MLKVLVLAATPLVLVLSLGFAEVLGQGRQGELPCWILPNGAVYSSFYWGRGCPFLPGDQVRSLSWADGKERRHVDSLSSIQAILANAPPTLSVGVERSGERIERQVDIKWSERAQRIRRYTGTTLGAFFLFYLLAMLTLRSRSRAPLALLAVHACVSSVLVVAVVGQSSTLLQVGAVVMLCLMPAALFHLGLVFPNLRPLVRSHPKILLLPYVALAPVALVGGWSVAEAPFFWRVFPALLGGLLLSGWLWLILSCWFAVRESPVGIARARARVLLVGAVASCLIFLVAAYRLDAPQPILFALSAAPLLLPLPVGLAISQYNLFSLPYNTRRSVASGLVAASYAAVVVGVAWLAFGSFIGSRLGEAFAVCFVIFVLLENARRGIFSSLESVLLRRAAKLKAAGDCFSVDVANLQDQRGVCQHFVETASGVLDAGSSAIHLRLGDGFVCAAAMGSGRLAQWDVAESALGMVGEADQPLHLGNIGESIGSSERFLLDMGVEIVVPVRHGRAELGVVIIGRRESGRSYSYEEEQFMLEISRTLAHAIHRVGLVEGLILADRRATTGRVGLAIAHEVGKQLGTIELLADSVSSKTGPGMSMISEIKRVAEDSQGALAEFIRGAKRSESEQSDQATAGEILDDTKRVVCSGRSSAHVIIRLDPSLVRARVPKILVRALVGIVDNAIDASAAGQSVAISFAQSGQGARIEIEDSGGGIDAEILPTVLRLGFTTRAAEGGQGIGLTIASEILKSLDATLDIHSTTGQGTTVSIALPPSAIGFPNTGRTREARAHIPSSG